MEKTTVSPGSGVEEREELLPLYHVVLLDDDEHTYDYVIEMLQKLFLLSGNEAFERALEVDTTGRAIVMTCELPQAEFARDQIHAFGPDPRMPKCRGSMRAILEPASH
jgi:ATP-dependent Clp protease adaptor protein ClpS